jgi:hypothetical protein
LRLALGIILLLLRTTGVATAILILPYSGMTYAANWQSAVALPTTVEYDSNPLLSTSSKKAVTRTIIAPDYSLVGTSGLDEFRFGLGLNLERSSDPSMVLDREDPNVQLGWQRENETGGFGLTAKYAETSTLSGATQDTGVVAPDGTQKQYSLGGNWSTALSERSTLANDTDYTSVNYDIDSLISYDEVSTRLSWIYAWSERVELFTRFAVRHYEPEAGVAVASSNSYTPTAGVNFQISDRLEGTLYAGVNQVSGEEGGSTGQGGFKLHYIGERFDTSIDAGRSTVASGEGGFVEVDELQGAWSYSVDETRRAGFDASWQDSKGKTPNTLRKFGAWASQELSPFWIARLSLAYKQRQQNGLPDASANVLGLTLTYSHPDF